VKEKVHFALILKATAPPLTNNSQLATVTHKEKNDISK